MKSDRLLRVRLGRSDVQSVAWSNSQLCCEQLQFRTHYVVHCRQLTTLTTRRVVLSLAGKTLLQEICTVAMPPGNQNNFWCQRYLSKCSKLPLIAEALIPPFEWQNVRSAKDDDAWWAWSGATSPKHRGRPLPVLQGNPHASRWLHRSPRRFAEHVRVPSQCMRVYNVRCKCQKSWQKILLANACCVFV